jgi:poly-gamma-glutamate synthesis protein (capsule biosynthesis protein)
MVEKDSGNTLLTSHRPGKLTSIVSLIVFFSFLIVGCSQGERISAGTPTAVGSTNQSIPGTEVRLVTATATSLPEPSPSPTEPPINVWFAPYLPEKMRLSISLPTGYVVSESPEGADVLLTVDDQDLPPASQWIYALVAPFPTITDGVTDDELQAAWAGIPSATFDGAPILMDSNTEGVLTASWGAPAPNAVKVVPADQLLDEAWASQPSWAIVPFEMLEPRWKVLTIDGQSPIHKEFNPAAYALNIHFVFSGKLSIKPNILNLPTTNRDAAKLTAVALTGVTAMVRATAFTMETKGITYPAEDIGSLLSEADITHISNEIPFSPDCPYPAPTQENLVFCSNPSYIELLKAVGTDIIELTGDHFMDYGAEATLYTLQMYKALGWPYYGGGANAEEARQPVRLQSNGNKIAFMGCNVGCQVKPEIPCDAIATDTHPGAAQCDFNYISTEIPALRDEGYQVIFTFQHREYYTYTAQPDLVNDFGLVATAGAAIVSGSQAHQPHGFSFENGATIHYGLGNLFFDQFHFCPDYACDDAFIDQHVFYDGTYISTELITIRFVDSAKPRLMTPEERQHFLETIFNASSW